QALHLAGDGGSADRMGNAVELAAHILHRRGRAREVATLVGALEAVQMRLPLTQEQLLPRRPLITQVVSGTGSTPLALLGPAGLDEDRVAGRSLSLERAADLALRVLDEELAAASPAEGRERGDAAGRADTPRRQGP